MSRAALVAIAVCLVASTPARAQRPSVFSAMGFEEARRSAQSSGRLLVVDVTAKWCVPCQEMDDTTWSEESVVRCVERCAIAVQVDVEEEPELTRALRVSAMPTLILYREGAEFDRLVGYRGPETVVRWLEAAARGNRLGLASPVSGGADPTPVVPTESVAAPPVPASDSPAAASAHDPRARWRAAAASLRDGRLEEATRDYVWLWQNLVRLVPGWTGVRIAFLGGDIADLSARHASARQAFRRLRDETEAALRAGTAEARARDAWAALNEAAGEPRRTVEWLRHAASDTPPRACERPDLSPEALASDPSGWAALGRCVLDPVGGLVREHEDLQDVLLIFTGEAAERPRARFRDRAGRLYAALLAAGREGDAARFSVESRRLDAGAEMTLTLIRAALAAGQPREEHIWWAERTALPEGGDIAAVVRRRLNGAH